MKRIAFRTTAALLVLVALVACSKKDKAKTSSTTSSAAATSSAVPASSVAASSEAPSGPAAADGGSTVTIKGFAFTPQSLAVKVGTEVTVTNTSSATHTFTSVSGPASFDTDKLPEGSSGKVKFDKAGTYAYHCSIHASMTGTVVVS